MTSPPSAQICAGWTDITEFACEDGKLYLAAIRDLHDHSIVGWSMGERQTTDLVVAALVMALGRREPSSQLVHHADHGTQYTSLEFTNRLADWKLNGSYGSVGDCWDCDDPLVLLRSA